jgi:hypothetical protein
MNILLIILLGLAGLKVGWNLLIPYALGMEAIKKKQPKTGAISLAPAVEIILLLAAWGCSFVVSESSQWISPGQLLLWGGSFVVISYIHLIIAGIAVGWLVSVINKRSQDPQA